MKIALNASLVLKTQTGIARYIRCLGEELSLRSDIDLSFFLETKWNSNLPLVQNNINIPLQPNRNWRKCLSWFSKIPGSYVLKTALEKPLFNQGLGGCDLVHEPNYIPISAMKPTVITICDMSWIKFPETLPRSRQKWLQKGLPKAVKEAIGIITISEFSKNEILNYFDLSADKIYAIPLGVESHYHPVDLETQRRALDSFHLSSNRYILAVGSLEPRKNIKTLISAYIKYCKTNPTPPSLAIAGPSGWGDLELPQGSSELIKKGLIQFLGFVPEESLPALYSGALLFTMPSLYEGFGLPVLEAMACGCPVLVANNSSLPEVCGNAGVAIPPLDVECWTRSIKELLDSPDKRESMSVLGLQRAKLFSWKSCAEQTVHAYKTFLNV